MNCLHKDVLYLSVRQPSFGIQLLIRLQLCSVVYILYRYLFTYFLFPFKRRILLQMFIRITCTCNVYNNISDTEARFLDLHLSVSNGFVSSKIYDKRDDFDFDIGNFTFLDGDVPRRASYGVYISQLIRFARVCNHVTEFNA